MRIELESVTLDIRTAENGFRCEMTCRGNEYHSWFWVGSTLADLWASLAVPLGELLADGVEEEEKE